MQVRLNSTLRDRFGSHIYPITTQASLTVREILEILSDPAPALVAYVISDQGTLNDNIIIFCNGRKIAFLDGLDTVVGLDDTLDVFPKTGAQRALDY